MAADGSKRIGLYYFAAALFFLSALLNFYSAHQRNHPDSYFTGSLMVLSGLLWIVIGRKKRNQAAANDAFAARPLGDR